MLFLEKYTYSHLIFFLFKISNAFFIIKPSLDKKKFFRNFFPLSMNTTILYIHTGTGQNILFQIYNYPKHLMMIKYL